MAFSVQNWQLYKSEITDWMNQELDLMPEPTYTKIFGTDTSSKLFIYSQDYTTGGPMTEVSELGDAVEVDSMEGYGTTFEFKIYRNQETFSSDWFETDQSGKAQDIAKGLARRPKYNRDLRVMGLIRNQFNTSITFGNSKPLISLTQPLKDGSGTFANTYLDGVQRPLDYDNLLSLEEQMYNMVSDAGNILSTGDSKRNKLLVVTPKNREMAFQLAKVDTRPDTAERAGNYFVQGAKYDVLVTKWIGWDAAKQAGETTVARTSTSNYWDSMYSLIDVDLAKKYAMFYGREGYEKFDDEVNKSNQAIIKYAMDKFAFSSKNPRWIVSSKGDNSTYAG